MRISKSVFLLACFAGGSWAATAQAQSGPYQYFAITPCRVIDTRRVSSQTTGAALPNPGPHNFRIQGNCNVPDGAKAVSLNATVITPNRAGDLRLFPVTGSPPLVATMSYNANEPALSNGAIVPLATVAAPGDKDLAVQHAMPVGAGGLMHLTIDITGYFQ